MTKFVPAEAALGERFRLMPESTATAYGYSSDKRRRRREHRRNAKSLRGENKRGGQMLEDVARWHLFQARYWGR